MKTYLFASVLSFMLLISACNPTTEKDRNPEIITDDTLQVIQEETQKKAPEKDAFQEAFQDFLLAIKNEDTTGFNQFINAERGLWIIENPGAMPKMTPVKNILEFKREYQDRPFFTINENLDKCNLKEVKTLPKFNCDGVPENEVGFEKQGCFVADAEKFKTSNMHKFASLTPEQEQAIEATLPFLTKTVLHTKSAYKFHFGYINNQWKILFIDLMIPCSA